MFIDLLKFFFRNMIVFTIHQISTCQSESSLGVGAGSLLFPISPFLSIGLIP